MVLAVGFAEVLAIDVGDNGRQSQPPGMWLMETISCTETIQHLWDRVQVTEHILTTM